MKKCFLIIAVILSLGIFIFVGCAKQTSTPTQTQPTQTQPTQTQQLSPIKIGLNLGFTGFMALDATPAYQGVLTKLDEVGWKVLGRPIELIKDDNASDPTTAVDKAKKQVESDKVSVEVGLIYSPNAFAVVDYLNKSGTGIPYISFFGHGSEIMSIGAKLAFIPMGIHSRQGYMLGKYLTDTMGYKTATVIYLDEDTGATIMDGMEKAFKEAGGSFVQRQAVPMDTLDFSSYITAMKPADVCVFWIFGDSVGPFLNQYASYGMKMPLAEPMVSCLQEPIMAQVADNCLNIIGSEHYVPLIDNPTNNAFVDEYVKKWGEQPVTDSFGGYTAISLFLEAVKATNGDTSPLAIKNAMQKITFNTLTGPYTMSAAGDAFIGTGNFYIVKSVKIGDRYCWQPIKEYDKILFSDVLGQ